MPTVSRDRTAVAAALIVAAAFVVAPPAVFGAGTAYNEDVAIELAKFCAIAYCPESDVLQWACPDCDPTFRVMNDTIDDDVALQTYVLSNDQDKVAVVWKGTDPLSWAAWASDLTICKLTASSWCGDGCELHKGFVDDYFAMRSDVVNSLKSALAALPNGGRDAEVYVTGHSLGAALATLFAFDIARDLGIQPITYTFGGPRVGNDQFSAAFASSVNTMYRVVHDEDIVPHLPPHALGWWHVDEQVYCDSDSPDSCKAMPGNEQYCDSVLGALGCTSVPDHGHYMGVNYFDFISLGSQSACRS